MILLLLVESQDVVVTWAGKNHVVLRGGHRHREQNIFKHVHHLFWPREGNVDDEVEGLPSLVEDIEQTSAW